MRLSYSVFTSYINCVIFIGAVLFLLFIVYHLLLLHILTENENLKQFFSIFLNWVCLGLEQGFVASFIFVFKMNY